MFAHADGKEFTMEEQLRVRFHYFREMTHPFLGAEFVDVDCKLVPE